LGCGWRKSATKTNTKILTILEDQNPSEKLENAWLGGGVFAEILLGFFVASWDGWQAIKYNPLNQPVADIKAIAVIDVNQTNLYLPDFSVLQDTHLELMGTNIYGQSFASLIPQNLPRRFVHRKYIDNSITFTGYAFDFEQNPVPAIEFDNPDNPITVDKSPVPKVKEVLNETKTIWLYINFIPKTDQILRGRITLKVNGFPKEFKIGQQTTDTNYSVWNPNMPGIFLRATNVVP
jgi:hypothetical protein